MNKELNPEQWNERGLAYEQEKEYKKSFECYEKSAKMGYAHGQRNLGSCYEHGRGVPKDQNEAVRWYTKAAEQGHGEAQNNLGDCYDRGIGVEASPQKAVHWYGKSAETGFPWGMCNLASCYAEGYGIEKKPEHAFEWYVKAAEMGYPLGQYSVGVCYFHAIGVEKDPIKAIDWFKKAAEQGDENAIHNLQSLNVKQCPSCKKWDTIFSQKIHNGKEDMLVCINEQCPKSNVVLNAVTGAVISDKKCPTCGSDRNILNSGAWVCWNEKCSQYKQIDRRF